MHVLTSDVVALLRSRGLVDRAAWAEKALPTRLDVDRNASLLRMLEIDPSGLAPVEETRQPA